MLRPEFTDCYTTPPGYHEYCELCQQAVEWFKVHLYFYSRVTTIGYLVKLFGIEKDDAAQVYENVWSIFGPEGEFSIEDENENVAAA